MTQDLRTDLEQRLSSDVDSARPLERVSTSMIWLRSLKLELVARRKQTPGAVGYAEDFANALLAIAEDVTFARWEWFCLIFDSDMALATYRPSPRSGNY